MLDLRCNNMVSLITACLKGRLERPVIRLTSAGCKKNLIRPAPQYMSGFFPRRGNRRTALLRNPVYPGRISIVLRKKRQHLGDNIRIRSCRRRIIKIYHVRPPVSVLPG